MNPAHAETLKRQLHRELTALLGDQLDQIVLYGSRARGDARPDSDFDILIVLRDEFDYAAMIEKTSELVSRLSLDYDTVISRAFTTRYRLDHEMSPYAMNVRREGVPL